MPRETDDLILVTANLNLVPEILLALGLCHSLIWSTEGVIWFLRVVICLWSSEAHLARPRFYCNHWCGGTPRPWSSPGGKFHFS